VVCMYQCVTPLGYCRLRWNDHGRWGTGGGLEYYPYVIVGNMPTREDAILAWYEAQKGIRRHGSHALQDCMQNRHPFTGQAMDDTIGGQIR